MTTVPPTLPAPTRHVTAISPTTGVSSILVSEAVPMARFGPDPSQAGGIWVTRRAPVDAFDNEDLTKTQTSAYPTPPFSSNVSYVDFAPGTASPMHFTTSLDYIVVIHGSLEYGLSDNSVTTLKAGDIVVQRGLHNFSNKTQDWARLLCVMLPAEELLVQGKPMEGLRFL